jgi:hypothetical protein
LNVVVGYHVLNPWHDNLVTVSMKNGIMTSKSEINLQNFYVYNSSFGQKEGEVSVNCLPGRLTIKRVTYLYTKSYNEK